MTENKPNNLPWIILGGICGLGLLGLFGFGFYSGAKVVSDEISVTIPEFPENSEQSKKKHVLTIFVDDTNKIVFDGESVEDVKALNNVLVSMDRESLESTVFILRLSEKSSHARLIAIKDLLDGFEVRSMIEIMRSDEK